jgi:hypothetical protein
MRCPTFKVFFGWVLKQTDTVQLDFAYHAISTYEWNRQAHYSGRFEALSDVLVGLMNRGKRLSRKRIRLLTCGSDDITCLVHLHDVGLLVCPTNETVCWFDARMLVHIITNILEPDEELSSMMTKIVDSNHSGLRSKNLRWELYIRGHSVDVSDLVRARKKIDKNLNRYLQKARAQRLDTLLPVSEDLQDRIMSHLSRLELRRLLRVACGH